MYHAEKNSRGSIQIKKDDYYFYIQNDKLLLNWAFTRFGDEKIQVHTTHNCKPPAQEDFRTSSATPTKSNPSSCNTLTFSKTTYVPYTWGCYILQYSIYTPKIQYTTLHINHATNSKSITKNLIHHTQISRTLRAKSVHYYPKNNTQPHFRPYFSGPPRIGALQL